MPGNAGALAHGSRGAGAMGDAAGNAAGAITATTLQLWQGAGANAAAASAVALQDGLNQAQQSLIAARATMNWYSQEVEQDNLVLMQNEQQETQLKTEKAQDEKQLATLKAHLATVEARLAHAIAANEAARAAASPLIVGGPIFPTAPAAPVPQIDTSQFIAEIAQLNQQISLVQFAIQTLDQKIQACEHKKTEYEAKLKAASAKVTQEMHVAMDLWPKAGLGSVNIQNVTGCIPGYTPPAPSQPGFLDRFVSALPAAAGIVLTSVVTLPLDETGAGEAIDGATATALLGSDTAASGAAVTTDVATTAGSSDLVSSAAAKVPEEWGPGAAARNGEGTRWADPLNHRGNTVRVDPGNPDHPDPWQQVDHVHVNSGGKPIGSDGNPVPSGRVGDPAAHIPYSQWSNWSSWNTP